MYFPFTELERISFFSFMLLRLNAITNLSWAEHDIDFKGNTFVSFHLK